MMSSKPQKPSKNIYAPKWEGVAAVMKPKVARIIETLDSDVEEVPMSRLIACLTAYRASSGEPHMFQVSRFKGFSTTATSQMTRKPSARWLSRS